MLIVNTHNSVGTALSFHISCWRNSSITNCEKLYPVFKVLLVLTLFTPQKVFKIFSKYSSVLKFMVQNCFIV